MLKPLIPVCSKFFPGLCGSFSLLLPTLSTSVMHGSVAVCLWLIKRANLFYFILIYSHMSVEIFVLGR